MLRAAHATSTDWGPRGPGPGPRATVTLSQYRDPGSSRCPRSRPGPIQLDSDFQVELEDGTARLGGTGTRPGGLASGGITTVLL